MSVLTIETPPTVTACELLAVHTATRRRVFGHWGGDGGCNHGCACPTPPDSIAARIGDVDAERLTDLLVRFGYQVHTPDDLAEMIRLGVNAGA